MGRKLTSFRFDSDRLEELQELANVYTNGNATRLLENLIRRMYFLEPLALRGKYRTPGFGITGKEQQRFKEAWEIWTQQTIESNTEAEEAKANIQVSVTINGDYTSLKRSEIRQLAHILRIPIDTRCVYTISVKKADQEDQERYQNLYIQKTGEKAKSKDANKNKLVVYTHGRTTHLSEETIKEICKATGLGYNPKQAFNIHAYWG